MNNFIVMLLCAVLGACAPIDYEAKLLQENSDSIVKLTRTNNVLSGGTGFRIESENGSTFILTNAHVCELSTNGYLKSFDKRKNKHTVKVIEVSESTDLCLVEDVPSLPALKPALSYDYYERIYALGHPILLDAVISSGFIINAETTTVGRSDIAISKCVGPKYSVKEVDVFFGLTMPMCVMSVWAFQSSVIIHPGNSGSPVLTKSGQVIGVMFAGNVRTNYGLFIPINIVNNFLNRIRINPSI